MMYRSQMKGPIFGFRVFLGRFLHWCLDAWDHAEAAKLDAAMDKPKT